jgi:hypothetical protein
LGDVLFLPSIEMESIKQAREWDIRNVREDDLPHIYSTWIKSMRYGSMLGKSCRGGLFSSEYTQVIDYILNEDDSDITVACHKEDPHVVFGYLVYQPDALHFAYVKQEFRKFGILKSLIEESGFKLNKLPCFTHRTLCLKQITAKYPDLIYNPFKLYKRRE